MPCGVKKDHVMQLKPSNWCITVAMKTQMTTMIFDKKAPQWYSIKKHHKYALKYSESTAMLSWDDYQIEMSDHCNISESMMFWVTQSRNFKKKIIKSNFR